MMILICQSAGFRVRVSELGVVDLLVCSSASVVVPVAAFSAGSGGFRLWAIFGAAG